MGASTPSNPCRSEARFKPAHFDSGPVSGPVLPELRSTISGEKGSGYGSESCESGTVPDGPDALDVDWVGPVDPWSVLIGFGTSGFKELRRREVVERAARRGRAG